jgi:hypothetical protein
MATLANIAITDTIVTTSIPTNYTTPVFIATPANIVTPATIYYKYHQPISAHIVNAYMRDWVCAQDHAYGLMHVHICIDNSGCDPDAVMYGSITS